ncbi:hypothetical protein P152DRAFT_462959 [Eremomyces bilateralis CBS 781.70]|uniref:WKF domain-containing protein n=1 Tax=Eremomyces bilateralis CBS 781.70 TaxID=1392243 RepID=A0A6G1FQP5_9PEZI|nr:uncharacterized protein P152DRAFT_462959 [Eremomyces bilateralis CBS 781.70]KAF1808030.1 hypothetical protein P152DRAFT_462959 [Eremomyces bilateralis CBS 781.70]
MSSTRVPAWKRLGLELKASNTNDTSPAATNISKRKWDANEARKAVEIESPAKRTKSAGSPSQFQFGFSSVNEPTGKAIPSRYSSKASSANAVPVSNGDLGGAHSTETPAHSKVKINGKDRNTSTKREPKKPKKPKAKKQPASAPNAQSDEALGPPAYVPYLETYFADHGNWKFNKHHQTRLLNNLFHLINLPPKLDEAIAQYVAGLQSFGAREHLRTSAYQVCIDSSEEAAEATETETSKMTADDIPDELRKAEALSSRLLQTKKRLQELEGDEAEEEVEKKRLRLQQRLRAEQILLALSESDHKVKAKPPPVAPAPPPTAAPRQQRFPPVADDDYNGAVVQGFNKVTGALGSVSMNKKIVFDEEPEPAVQPKEPKARATRLRKKRTGLAAVTGVSDDDDSSSSSSSGSDSSSDESSSSEESSSEDEA